MDFADLLPCSLSLCRVFWPRGTIQNLDQLGRIVKSVPCDEGCLNRKALVNVFVALHEAPRIDLKMNKIGEQLQRARNRFSQLQF